MSVTYREPEGWEQHPQMSKSRGYLDAFRTPDHTAFVDIIEYKPHVEAEYVVEYLEQVGGPESFRTTCRERIDCADESEAWEAAIDLMERSLHTETDRGESSD